MARLTAVALWLCAWTVAAWEAGKKQGQDGWLDDHNYYRCLHGADPVTWDSTLESQAQAVADAMPPMAHSDSYNAPMPAGENLAMGMGTFTWGDYTGPYNQNCATHNWYEEYECWGSGENGWKGPTCTIGHFTAMVWKNTTKIGCASNGNYFVCQYGAEPPNFNIFSCGTNECVEAKNYDEAGCKAGTRSSYKIDWGTGNGWCSSDLDEYIGDASTASACWRMCENTYGSDLTAIDWTPDGECYCQDDCQCMEDRDDGNIHLITSSAVASLPNTCVSACPAEEAAFQTCISMQWPIDDDYFADDDDGGGYFLANGGQSCDDACASSGGCDLSAITAAAASMEACKRVLDDLGVSYGASGDYTSPGDSSGCTYHAGDPGWAQLFGNPTCGTVDPDADRERVCACNDDDDDDDDDDFAPNTCADVQEWLSTGECADGPKFCRAEYDAWVECHYEDMAREELGQACDFTCSPDKKSNRDNVGLLILIIVCSVAGCLCLLAISTAIIYSFGGCLFCFAKHKKKRMPARVAEPSSSAESAPVPLAVAQYAEPPPMSPGTFVKTQEHIRRTAALMAEAPPSPPGPPPLAPIKATETLAPEMP